MKNKARKITKTTVIITATIYMKYIQKQITAATRTTTKTTITYNYNNTEHFVCHSVSHSVSHSTSQSSHSFIQLTNNFNHGNLIYVFVGFENLYPHQLLLPYILIHHLQQPTIYHLPQIIYFSNF